MPLWTVNGWSLFLFIKLRQTHWDYLSTWVIFRYKFIKVHDILVCIISSPFQVAWNVSSGFVLYSLFRAFASGSDCLMIRCLIITQNYSVNIRLDGEEVEYSRVTRQSIRNDQIRNGNVRLLSNRVPTGKPLPSIVRGSGYAEWLGVLSSNSGPARTSALHAICWPLEIKSKN